MQQMPETVKLKINGIATDLSWTEFVNKIESTNTSILQTEIMDSAFLLQCSVLLFLMQAGFVMVVTGSLSTKRRVGALVLKNLGDTVICAVLYTAIGYALSYGDGTSFIGYSGFAGYGSPFCQNGKCRSKEYILFLYRFLKTAVSVTILSGCVAERIRLLPYYLIISLSSCFVQPIVSRWTRYPAGWAYPYQSQTTFPRTGVIDFAGAGEVYLAGAVPALLLLPLIGPRPHRFRGEGFNLRLPGQNNYYTTLGTTLLWLGWYGQVCGGVETLRGGGGAVVGRVALNTTVAAVAASVVTIILGLKYEKKLLASNASNGILSGLVGITGGCATVHTEWALFIGVISAVIYFSMSEVFLQLQIDDVVDGVPLHFCCGVWSLLAPTLFSAPQLVQAAYPGFEEGAAPCGLFYTCQGLGVALLGVNLLYGVGVIAWVASVQAVLILPLWWFDLLSYQTMEEGEDGELEGFVKQGTSSEDSNGNDDHDFIIVDHEAHGSIKLKSLSTLAEQGQSEESSDNSEVNGQSGMRRDSSRGFTVHSDSDAGSNVFSLSLSGSK